MFTRYMQCITFSELVNLESTTCLDLCLKETAKAERKVNFEMLASTCFQCMIKFVYMMTIGYEIMSKKVIYKQKLKTPNDIIFAIYMSSTAVYCVLTILIISRIR